MSRLQLLLLLLFITNLSSAQDLKGTIKDKHSGDILIGVSIKVLRAATIPMVMATLHCRALSLEIQSPFLQSDIVRRNI
ncbi:hypothetical protein [Sphingobacterium sp. DR205]|uniref:hypothetical protein n=1 Tax=Sphingobacterium sp. DR205 TaxID=2713573 RepID=UPI0013E4DEA3|nr:hypothetical protein [Sphingobacterium sp. DR205]QIH35534.1 hypothetical protein G6053_22815 [Sphingobacterium sp. DR205]